MCDSLGQRKICSSQENIRTLGNSIKFVKFYYFSLSVVSPVVNFGGGWKEFTGGLEVVKKRGRGRVVVVVVWGK